MDEHKLTEYRNKIGEVDDKILDLLVKRFDLTDEVGRFKKRNGIPVENKQVEMKILSRFNERLEDISSKESILKVYKEIFSESKVRQRNV
jgi:chorismate mutase